MPNMFIHYHMGISYWCVAVMHGLEPRGNYMYRLLYQSVMLHFVFVGFV
jgi:hypothetical protein